MEDAMVPKYVQLSQQLRWQLRQMKQNGINHLPTEAELCQYYSCSRQTVRKALDLLKEDNLIIKRRGSGSYLSTSIRSRQVAVITTCNEEYIYPQLLNDIQKELDQAGFDCENYVTHQSLREERRILEDLIHNKPAGIILERALSAFPSPNIELVKQLKNSGVCVVCLHAPWQESELVCVGDENFNGSYMLVQYLINKGRSKLGGIFKNDEYQGIERYRGFISAILDYNCQLPDFNILWYSSQDSSRLKNGELFDDYLQYQINNTNGIVCYNDEIANQLIQSLHNYHIKVPDDISVVSFDDSHLSHMGPIGITSLRHERHAVGRTAARVMLAQLSGQSVKSVLLPWTIVKRHSG